jgi:hypothetical protein
MKDRLWLRCSKRIFPWAHRRVALMQRLLNQLQTAKTVDSKIAKKGLTRNSSNYLNPSVVLYFSRIWLNAR